jgi:hypothetical protein
MTIKAYDGTTWQNQKSLKIYEGSAWATAKQAWIYNGTSWLINYPEFPSSSSNPSITVISGIDGRIGCTYSTTTGSWNSNDAYIPTSYTYQWTRSDVDIPGATSSTYTTNASDSEKIIGVKVRATNQRGNTTTSSSTGTQMLPHVTSLTGTNTTQAVSTPTVSFNVSDLSYSGSWNAISNATTYETVAGGTAGSPSVNIGNRSFSGTGTAGTASFSVRAVNTNRIISLSWPSALGAISYDLYVNGSLFGNVGNVTSYSYNPPDDNARTFTVYPRTANTQGYGASVASAIAAAATYSSYGSGSGTLVQPNATSPTYAFASATTSNLSVSWGGSNYATKYRVYWASASSISLDPAVNYDAPEWTGTSASYNVGTSEGNTFYFYISASGDNNVWTPYGAYKASATVAYTAPGTPSPSTSSITSSSFLISWGSVSGANSYAVSVGTSFGGADVVNTSGITGTSYGVTSLSPNTSYYVTITAYKNGYGYGSPGYASATTTQSTAYSISTPTRPTFYRSGTTVKWGFDNPSFSGAFTPFGVEWEVGNNASTGNISAGNTKSYNTNYISTSGLPSIWHYIVGTHAGDIPATSSPRYLRFRLYGMNSVTYASIDGPWSAWSL